MKIIIQILIYAFSIAVLTYDFYGTNELFIERGVIGLVAFLFFARSFLLFKISLKYKMELEILLGLIILCWSFYGFYMIFGMFIGYGFTGRVIPIIFKLCVFSNILVFIISAFDLLGLNRISRKRA